MFRGVEFLERDSTLQTAPPIFYYELRHWTPVTTAQPIARNMQSPLHPCACTSTTHAAKPRNTEVIYLWIHCPPALPVDSLTTRRPSSSNPTSGFTITAFPSYMAAQHSAFHSCLAAQLTASWPSVMDLQPTGDRSLPHWHHVQASSLRHSYTVRTYRYAKMSNLHLHRCPFQY